MRHTRRTLAPMGDRFLVATLLACAGATTALADDFSWIAGSGSWGNPSHWTPFGLPGPADLARIGNIAGVADNTVFADRDVAVLGLFLSDGMGYQNQGWRTSVSGPTVVGADSRIFLSDAVAGSDLVARSMTLSGHNARVILEDSGMRTHDTIHIGSGAFVSLRGGDVRITNPGVGLVNEGSIMVGPGASFLTHDGDQGLLDLDGTTEAGRVVVSGVSPSSITIRASALTDPFDGVIELGEYARLHMLIDAGWVAAPGSLIRALAGSEAQRAEINGLGRHLDLQGSVEVRALGSTGVLRIAQQTTVGPQASATVFERGQLQFLQVTLRGGTFASTESLAGGGVFFNGPTNWEGAVTIDGAAQQNGPATVLGTLGASIDAGLLDMDGHDGLTSWTINAPLLVNAGSISHGGGNRFEGQFSIAGGFLPKLTINLDDPAASWTMAGRMEMQGAAIGTPTRLAGSPVRFEGELVVRGGAIQIAADLRVLNNAAIHIEPGTVLRTQGRTAIGGATFTGAGVLHNGTGGLMSLEAGASLGPIDLRNDASLRLGEQPGSAGLATAHRYEQGANGRLTMDVGGPVRGLDHDALIVSGGTATLAGQLTLTLFDPGGAAAYRPVVGDTFTILTAIGGVDGAFDIVSDTLHDGLRYTWEAVYEPNAVAVRVASVSTIGCPADLDGDGVLTIYDQIAFFNAFEQGHPWADLDGDGQMTIFDFLAFQNAFAAGCP